MGGSICTKSDKNEQVVRFKVKIRVNMKGARNVQETPDFSIKRNIKLAN